VATTSSGSRRDLAVDRLPEAGQSLGGFLVRDPWRTPVVFVSTPEAGTRPV
jgi:hypothetical protein